MLDDPATMTTTTAKGDQPAAAGGAPAPRVRQWQHLSGRDFAAIDRERTVVMLTCSPLEVHGPHLPVITDACEADGLAARARELLAAAHPEIEYLQLPLLWTAADVLPHPGSVAFRSSTIIRALSDIGRSLCKQGFRHIWLSNFHGGPRHFVAMEVACDQVNRRWGGRMVSLFSLLLNRLTGGETDLSGILGHVDGIDREALVGDAHGGAVETSLMLHLLGEHVKADYAALGRNTVEIKLAREGQPPLVAGDRPTFKELMRGFKHKLKYYETETYSGSPALGTAALGEEFLDILAGHCAEALGQLWRGELQPGDCHSPLWKARWIFTHRWISALFERVMGYRNQVW